jgi:hypothetical protein
MFLFLSLIFFFYKIREQKGRTGSVGGMVGTGGRGQVAWKGLGA